MSPQRANVRAAGSRLNPEPVKTIDNSSGAELGLIHCLINRLSELTMDTNNILTKLKELWGEGVVSGDDSNAVVEAHTPIDKLLAHLSDVEGNVAEIHSFIIKL